MIETMLTYINEEYMTNKSILKKRKEQVKEFINLTKYTNYDRLIILATGSSANAIECAKYYVENILKINIEIKIPSVFSNYNKCIDKSTLYVAVTQGGYSYSIIEALKEVNKSNGDVVTLTANLDSPICKESKCIVDIGCGVEKVGYVTKGFSATVLTFIIMGLELAFEKKIINEKKYNSELIKISETIDNIEKVIEKSMEWYKCNKDELIIGERFVSIGYGPGYGVVRESDTKITETVRIPMNGHELEEYMHGPYLSLSDKDHIIFIETESKLEHRQSELKSYLDEYTKHTYKITYKECSDNKHDLALGVKVDEMISPLIFVIPIQILSYLLAEDKGNKLSEKTFTDFDEKLNSKVK